MEQPKGSVQSQQKRSKNFNEVSSGYTKRVTIEEARRCPQCSDPVCMQACPIGIDVPGFIRLLREGNVAGAYEIIKSQSSLSSICGRICSSPCEAACILNDEEAPIGIRSLERYAADFGRPRQARKERVALKGKKIAIVGSGPAGISAAADLTRKGYQVKIFESLDQPGGVLRYGIPEFRVPRKILDFEIEELQALGVDIETNCSIGQTLTFEELRQQGFESILLAVGAGIPKFIDLPGADMGGVYYGEEFLMRVNMARSGNVNPLSDSFPVGDNILVIGSGNTALDCARVGIRLQKKVTLVFRRTMDDIRVRKEEVQFAQEEGVRFEPMVKPIEILPNQHNFVSGIKCMRIDYADVDSTGDWSLIPVPGSEFIMEADTVIIAVGHNPNSLVGKLNKNIKFNEDGSVIINELTGMTTVKGIFAAGNVMTNAGPIVEAIASGKRAAQKIHEYMVI